MKMGTNVLNRAALVGVGLLFAGMSSACSSGGDATGETTTPPKPAGVQIENPKDALATDPCNLLTPEAAQSAGLNPVGRVSADPLNADAAPGCIWDVAGQDGNNVLLTATNVPIQSYLDRKSTYTDFQELNIAGHPAVRANNGDPARDGFCDIFLATKDGQNLAAQSDTNVGSGVDPCSLAQKALEASVPAIPAAK